MRIKPGDRIIIKWGGGYLYDKIKTPSTVVINILYLTNSFVGAQYCVREYVKNRRYSSCKRGLGQEENSCW